MDKRQLRSIGLILLLPILFAGAGYFGMKLFLSGGGPKTVNPEKASIIEQPAEVTDKEVETETASDNGSEDIEIGSSDNGTSQSDESNNTSKETQASEKSESSTAESATEKESAPEVSEPASPKLKYEFDSVNFFSLQVGSYSSLSNASKHVNSLMEEGIHAYVFAGNNNKVMAGVSTTRDGVDAIKQQLAETVPDAFVKGMMVVPDALEYSEEDQAGLKAYDAIVKEYKSRLDKNIAFVSQLNQKSVEEVKAFVESDIQSSDAIIGKIAGFSGADTFKESLSVIKQNVSASKDKAGQLINKDFVPSDVFSVYMKEFLEFNELN